MYRLGLPLLALIPYTLGTPVSMAQRDSSSGCTEDSLNGFEWTVEGFDFHASYTFTTPAHQNSWGYVNFNLLNSAVPNVLSCSAQSDQLQDFYYGTQWYQCTTTNETSDRPAPASFAFNRPTGELDINQSWTCDDQDPKYPTTFSASGKANLTLGCTTTSWQNPNWTIGEIYSQTEIECLPATLELEPFQMSAVA